MNGKMVIAIDGFSGVGKGTLARSVAAYFSLPYLDTGLLYRAVGRKMLDASLTPDSEKVIVFAKTLRPADWQRDDLRTVEVDRAASQVAANPGIRAALLDMQRNFILQSGGVMDGRDIGTVIFPDADMKFFLTASPRVRAERRWRQYARHVSPEQREKQIDRIEAELKARDQMDMSRSIAPLRPAEDAIILDTDLLSAAEVLEKVIETVNRHCKL